ncbi:MAG: hypothetical protein AB1646_20310 [Thermodesulfobacteriota bacterium]
MTQRASHASVELCPDPHDFDRNYRYLKKLMQDLKKEDGISLRKEIFGDNHGGRALSKKEMKQLYKQLRKIEPRFEECSEPPIPDELESDIRDKESSQWLPWELEAIQKAEAWREEVQPQRSSARQMLEEALERIRRGEKIT